MRHLRVEPLPIDRTAARFIADRTTPAVERGARVLTWAADEHLLYALTAILWIAARRGDRSKRIRADHLALCVVTANILPHLAKAVVDQERPDRCEVHGPRRGIPRSGRAYDAFPSGHAVHVGALASALSWIYPRYGGLFWTAGGLLAATRVLVLAHWASDVVVGLAAGIAVERLFRPFTRSRLRSSQTKRL
jgi:membrane-associated phospholipid phosphatase